MAYDTTPPPPVPSDAPQPIAPWPHTIALFAVLALTTLYGHARAAFTTVEPAKITRYLSTGLLEWLLLGSVIAGIYRRREFFQSAFHNRANTLWQSVGIGIAAYFAGLFALAIVGAALIKTPLFHQRNEAYVLAIMPRSPLEFTLWFFVSLSAGVCEELIFRGYLLQQVTAWTRSPIASIFLGALLFGSVHLYEGLGAMLPLAALAVVYGFVVRHFKGDLRAVIVAHTLQDFLVAFLALAKPYLDSHVPKS